MEKKEKVLIVHNYYKIPGGEDTVVHNEKKMLEDNGHEVILYSRHNDEIVKKNLLGKILLPFETIFSLKTYREIKKVIKKENIDIVHVHNTLPLISPSVYKAAKSLDRPVFQTVHNFRFLCPGATFTKDNKICEECLEKGLGCAIKNKCYRNSKLQTGLVVIMIKFNKFIGSYNCVDKFITLTQFNKEKLSEFTDIKKIDIKPNFCLDDIELKKENMKKEKYFLFVGRLDSLKGIEFLVETWKEIHMNKLVIVGKGPAEQKITEYIYKNRIENIEMLGFKNKKEILSLMKYSKALIVPSFWYEGFPMTIVEAFSQKTLVIASNLGNLSQIIKDKENGLLFEVEDKNSLKKCVKLIAENEQLEWKLSKKCYEEFYNLYSKDINYLKLLEFYREGE